MQRGRTHRTRQSALHSGQQAEAEPQRICAAPDHLAQQRHETAAIQTTLRALRTLVSPATAWLRTGNPGKLHARTCSRARHGRQLQASAGPRKDHSLVCTGAHPRDGIARVCCCSATATRGMLLDRSAARCTRSRARGGSAPTASHQAAAYSRTRFFVFGPCSTHSPLKIEFCKNTTAGPS